MKLLLERWEQYLTEIGTCHSPQDGTWTSCDKDAVYSLTKKGARENSIDPSYVQRGTVVKTEKGKPPKLKAKYGVNSSRAKSAGRKTIAGDDISPKYSVSKYPEQYDETKGQKNDPNWPSQKKVNRERAYGKPNRKNHFHGYEEMNWLSRGLGHGVLEGRTVNDILEAVAGAFVEDERVSESNSSQLTAKCRSIGLITIGEAQKRILMSINAFSLAQDGKLNAPQDKQ